MWTRPLSRRSESVFEGLGSAGDINSDPITVERIPCEGMMSEDVSDPSVPTDRWKAWDVFLETTPQTGFMQSSWWADFRVTYNYQHFAAILKAQGAIIGGAVVLKYSYAP